MQDESTNDHSFELEGEADKPRRIEWRLSDADCEGISRTIKASQAMRDAIFANQNLDVLRSASEAIKHTIVASNAFRDIPKITPIVLPQLQSSAMMESLSNVVRITNALVKPEIFDTMRAASQAFIAAMPDYSEMMRNLSESMRSSLESYAYLRQLRDSEWPLYLEGDEVMSSEIRSLGVMSGDELANAVFSIAAEHLDEAWLDSVRKRWFGYDDFTVNEVKLLEQALKHHEAGDYYASVALLMCMSEGLVEKYCGSVKKLEGDRIELFNMVAADHNLRPLGESGKRSYGFNTKDLMVILVIQVETGAYIWNLATTYVIETLFANGGGEAGDRHPRRNKICHGAQTDFGSLEHSLKAILSIDIIIRLGRVIAALGDEDELDRDEAEDASSPLDL